VTIFTFALFFSFPFFLGSTFVQMFQGSESDYDEDGLSDIASNSSSEEEEREVNGGTGKDESGGGVTAAVPPPTLPPDPAEDSSNLEFGSQARLLTSRRRLEHALTVLRGKLEELVKEGVSDSRKTHALIKNLSERIGAAKVSSWVQPDPNVRRLLTGDTSQAAAVNSLKAPVDYFFGRRPPMDARGVFVQSQVIDHRTSSFHKRAREALLEEVLNSVKKALWDHVRRRSIGAAEKMHEIERIKVLSSAQLLDEAERAQICLDDPRCKVWEEVGQVMWKTNKKCAAECR